MYGNSRLPSYMNVLADPCDNQFSRWSLNTPNPPAVLSSTMRQPTISSSSASSFCFTQSPQVKLRQGSQTLTQRPKSTILTDSTMNDQQNTYINDLRQRYDSKTVVGIVKPMVHQRSYHLINHDSEKYKINQDAEMLLATDYHQSTRSLRPPSSSSSSPLLPPAPPSLPLNGSATVAYRSRRAPSQIHLNGQPPTVPRRHSSINNSRNPVSYRSSRTDSTCSSMAPINDSHTTPCLNSDEHNQIYQDRKSMIDVKRLELFYSSVGTLVRSAQSTACLFLTTARQLAGIEDWSYQQRGVPLWVYDTGANLKRARQVRLLLIQQDSCFTIWSTLVSNQAEVRLPKDYFITCWFPESSLLAVLQFEQAEACRLFYRNYFEILEYEYRANSTNIPTSLDVDTSETHLTESKSKLLVSTKEIPRRYSKLRSFAQRQEKRQTEPSFELRRCRSLSKIRTVKKSSISGPINFEHVNHLSNGCQQDRMMSSTMALRSLHASMTNLPSQGSLIDRPAYSNSRRTSVCFESRTTAV